MPFESHDAREKFKDAIRDQGRYQTWIADNLGVTKGYVSNVLNGRMPLTQTFRDRLNELLKTDI